MRALVLVVVIGCAAPAPAPAPMAPPTTAPPPAAAPQGAWADVTGATWSGYLEHLPADRWWPLASELVRGGELACPRQVMWCGSPQVDAPRPDETVADPCLRRAVLRRLLDRDGAVPDDVLAALTRLTGDLELIEVGATGRPDDQLIALAAAAERAGGPPVSLGGITPDRAADAVERQHLAAAVAEVDGRRDPDVLLRVAGDPTFPADVRVDAMFTIEMYATERDATAPARTAGQRLATLADTLVTDADCRIAAKAAEMRATLAADDRHVPRRPRTRDRATMRLALCRAQHYQGGDGELVLDTFVPARGLEVVYPDGRPSKRKHKPKRELIPRHDGKYGHYELRNFLQDWLGPALDQASGRACAGDECHGPTVDLTFQPDARGELVLTRVTIHRNLAGEKILADREAALAAADECDEGD